MFVSNSSALLLTPWPSRVNSLSSCLDCAALSSSTFLFLPSVSWAVAASDFRPVLCGSSSAFRFLELSSKGTGVWGTLSPGVMGADGPAGVVGAFAGAGVLNPAANIGVANAIAIFLRFPAPPPLLRPSLQPVLFACCGLRASSAPPCL